MRLSTAQYKKLVKPVEPIRPATGRIYMTLPVPPSANRYWRNYNGRTVVSKEASDYKDEVERIAQASCIEPLTGEVIVLLRFYRQQKSGDLDNRIKLTLDSLNGIAFRDDKQVVEIHAYRYDDPRNPRLEIEVVSTQQEALGSVKKPNR